MGPSFCRRALPPSGVLGNAGDLKRGKVKGQLQEKRERRLAGEESEDLAN